jgi:cytochrome c biogenesis protein CcmG/thiol:disulfide interchange protein DsbE
MTPAGEGHEAEHPVHQPRRIIHPLGGGLSRGWLILAAVVPLVLLIVLGMVLVSRGDAAGASIGSKAPDFALSDLDGDPIRLSDYAGRPVIVNFWASWCGPCVAEFPLLEDAASEHAADGLALVGVVYRDNAQAAARFMDEVGATWPAVMDPDGDVAQTYGIFGPPESFFINRDGTLVARQIGQLGAADLERHLAQILVKE